MDQPTPPPTPAPPAPAPRAAGTSPRAIVPQDRDPVLDLLRTGSLLVVVLWHWVFSTVRWSDDGPHVGNPVGSTPGMWLLTWFGQVMPIFFMVGGALHARSLERTGSAGFRRRRLRRLLPPAAPLLGLATCALLVAVGLGRGDWARAVVLVVSPLWFLATYLACVLVAPAAHRWHRRAGAGVIVLGFAAVVLVDWLRIGLGVRGPLLTAAAFVAVWLTVHQLGWFATGRPVGRRSSAWALLGVGVAGLLISIRFGPYPAAMVGVPGERLSNLGPPTVMVLWLALAQLGLVTLLDGPLRSVADRFAGLLSAAGEWSMTVYVWHLAAFAAFWAALVQVGLTPPRTVAADWWLQRPVWLVGPLLVAVPLCRLTRRFDRRRPAR